MAVITVEIPDEHYDRVVDAMAALYGYKTHLVTPATSLAPEMVEENPESREEFAARMIAQYVHDSMRSHETNMALLQAHEDAQRAASEVVLGGRMEAQQ